MAQTRKTAKKNIRPKNAAPSRPPVGATASSTLDHPTVAMVRGLAEVVEAHSLSELIVDTPELTLTLRRHGPGASVLPAAAVLPAPVMASQMTSAPAVHAASVEPAPAPAHAPVEAAALEKHHVVTSPFVGTFYRRPNPDATPYVEIGGRVAKGQALCIIEAMKLMNEIEADEAGTVVAVLVEDGEPVEYGQPLFKIQPA